MSRQPAEPSDPGGGRRPRGGTPARQRTLRSQGRETIGRLRAAAMQAFGQRGYHATRVDDIVELADTSHGTFYLYFSNKEDLLWALQKDCAEDMERLAADLPRIEPGVEGYKVLRDWIDEFAELYEAYYPVVRAWVEAAAVQGDELARAGRPVLEEFATSFAEQIAETHPDRDIDPQIAALAFVAMLERFHYFVATRQIDFERDRILDTLARIAHDGIFTRGGAQAG